MADIKIRSNNFLKIRLDTNHGIKQELSEDFSFLVPGYKYMQIYKSGKWDGKVRMFNMRSGEIYRGLMPRFYEWCDEKGYTYEIVDSNAMKPALEFDEDFLNRWSEYGKLEPKPHQIKAVKDALELNQALVLSPTGSGKSYICYLMCRYILENTDGKILITVPSTSLVEQLYKDFEDYAVNFDVEKNVHKIYSGKEKTTSSRIIISTWQSIYKLGREWFEDYDAYICDEAHGADSKSLSGIVENLLNCPIRIGLTGTLDGTKLHELEMLARFGPIVKATTTKELMDEGTLAPLNIKCVKLKYPSEEVKLVRYMDYQQEIDFLVTHPKRNLALVNLALKSKNNTLMLFNFIDKHGMILYEMLKERAEKYNKKIYYISGKVDVKNREEIRAILEKEDNAILLASMGTMSVGVNVKNLHNLIFCHPYKAKIKTLQSIGRTIRKACGKDGATLMDISDDLSFFKRGAGSPTYNTTYKHFIERLKIYESEGFDYKIYDFEIS